MKLKVSEHAGLKGLYFINVLEWFKAIFLSSPLVLPYELGLVTKNHDFNLFSWEREVPFLDNILP